MMWPRLGKEKGKKSSNRNWKKANQQSRGQKSPLTYLASPFWPCMALKWLFRHFFEANDLSQNIHLNIFPQVLYPGWYLSICKFKDRFVAYDSSQNGHLCPLLKVRKKGYKRPKTKRVYKKIVIFWQKAVTKTVGDRGQKRGQISNYYTHIVWTSLGK